MLCPNTGEDHPLGVEVAGRCLQLPVAALDALGEEDLHARLAVHGPDVVVVDLGRRLVVRTLGDHAWRGLSLALSWDRTENVTYDCRTRSCRHSPPVSR